jgi:hypothetical protein
MARVPPFKLRAPSRAAWARRVIPSWVPILAKHFDFFTWTAWDVSLVVGGVVRPP